MTQFQVQLLQLYERVRRPTYRTLAAHANRAGFSLRISTISDLLNARGTPRWETVETFLRAIARYAHSQQITLPLVALDLDRWHADYRQMENTLAERTAREGPNADGAPRPKRQAVVVPAQLPADVSSFTNRSEQLAILDLIRADLTEKSRNHSRSNAVVISAIGGTAGVGKTALAIHWGHRVAHHFPDGQLYVDLRGFHPDGRVVDPATAVRGFLDAFEIPPERVPDNIDAQAALYRSLLVRRRVLVVLDNARDSGQVRPLLPGAPSCVVVVTSRNQLTGLIAANGARPITIDLLSDVEAWEFLANRLDARRVSTEPQAVADLIAYCARLPLALAIVAAHTATRASTPLHALATELRDARNRLDILTSDDPATSIRAVFSWSYNALTPQAATLFRVLAVHPGPDVTAAAAASLFGECARHCWRSIHELLHAHLLTEQTPGRYSLHDLLRVYAGDLIGTRDPESLRASATQRMLDHYLHTAHAAARLLNPAREPIVLSSPVHGTTPEHLATHEQALAWFKAEYRVILALVDNAADKGLNLLAWQMTWTLSNFLERRGLWREWATVARTALAAADRLNELPLQARAHRALALALAALDSLDESHLHFCHALDLYQLVGDDTGEAHTNLDLAIVLGRLGDANEALRHARQALEVHQRAGHRHGQAGSLNAVGWYLAQLGDCHQALVSCQRALELFCELGDRNGEAATLDSLGYAFHLLGQYGQAAAHYRRAVDVYLGLESRYSEATTRIHLGETLCRTGDIEAARAEWRQALAILIDLDHADAVSVQTKLAALEDRPEPPMSTRQP